MQFATTTWLNPETDMADDQVLVLVDQIEPLIHDIRGHKVLLDNDLSTLYGVTAKRLNEQVRRNRERFPVDFMFQLTKEEADSLRLQNATLKVGRGQHRKYHPFAFTEHGREQGRLEESKAEANRRSNEQSRVVETASCL